MSHTPTLKSYANKRSIVLHTDDGEEVCRVSLPQFIDQSRKISYAEAIKHRWNCHDDLLAALSAVVGPDGWVNLDMKTLRAAQAAIAKAQP